VLTVLAVTMTVAVLLFTLPSLTIKLATYVPVTSAVKVGFTEVSDDKAAELPIGLDKSVHVYVKELRQMMNWHLHQE